jgi:hypothetical protein
MGRAGPNSPWDGRCSSATRQRQGESRRAPRRNGAEQQTPDEARGVRSPRRRSRAFTHAPVHRRQTDGRREDSSPVSVEHRFSSGASRRICLSAPTETNHRGIVCMLSTDSSSRLPTATPCCFVCIIYHVTGGMTLLTSHHFPLFFFSFL